MIEDKLKSSVTKVMAGSMAKPRLERTRHLKNVEYQPGHPADNESSHEESLPSPAPDPTPAPAPAGEKPKARKWTRETSFRVRGADTTEEIEQLCKFLGLADAAGLGILPSDWEARKSRLPSPSGSQPLSPISVSFSSAQSSSEQDDFKFDLQPNSFDSSFGSPPGSPVTLSSNWRDHQPSPSILSPPYRDGSPVFRPSPPSPTKYPATNSSLKVAESPPVSVNRFSTRLGVVPAGVKKLPVRSSRSSAGESVFPSVQNNDVEISRRHSEPPLKFDDVSPISRANSVGATSVGDAMNSVAHGGTSSQIGDRVDNKSLSGGVRASRLAVAVPSDLKKTEPRRTKSIGSLKWVTRHADEDEDKNEEINRKAVGGCSDVPTNAEPGAEARETTAPTASTRETSSQETVKKVEMVLATNRGQLEAKDQRPVQVLPKKPSWSTWKKGNLLGSGSFGTVYEGVGSNGMFFAVKEVPLEDQGRNAKQKQSVLQLEQEIALLSEIQHENIVQYLGTERQVDKLYIFLELVGKGSLASVYKQYDMFEDQIRAYTKQILNGVKYLHDHNIIHRDIKCANILVDTNGIVKLADFGMAKEVSKMDLLKSCKGSAYWMAPEVIDPRKTYNHAADIWSLGCTVLEMAIGGPPFGDLEWTRALWKVGHGEAPPIPEELPPDMQDFIRQCLEVSVAKRPTVDMLLTHPFVTVEPVMGPVTLVATPELSSIAEERSFDLVTNMDTSPQVIQTHTSVVRGTQGRSMRTRRSEFSLSSPESVVL